IAEGVASIPAAAIEARPTWAVALGVLGLAFAVLLGRAGWSRRALVVLSGAFVLAGTISWGPTPLRATFFDVGQGDSALLRFPTGEAMLIDTGGSERGGYDPGARNVLPALRALGVRRLAVLAISHPHADHIAGAKAILEGLEVGEVWICWHDEPNVWIQRLRRWARARGVPLRRPRRWRRGEVTVEPLWPRGHDTCALPGLGPNDNSVVLRVSLGEASILFTGDIERYAETALVEGGRRRLRATVLKVPHHGSETSSTQALLRAVRPRLAVISVGRGNRFALPDAAALRRYRRLQIPVARIDRLGAIAVDLWPSGRMRWSPAVSPLD
ncbi:MAG: MBL fold metallo-hydrolase, partial [Deltaproteobacteria bacterium]|nr:MBL fold metallo-hydrolase [Deltaproteobacteria bacterium]